MAPVPHDSLHQINRNLRALTDRLIRQRNEAPVIQPQILRAFRHEITQAESCIGPASPASDEELAAYRKMLRELAKMLPGVLVALETRKLQLRTQFARLCTLADWSETNRTSLGR